MNVVIFGAGRRGLRLARHLIQEKKSVTFLDQNKERCTQAVSKLDCLAICGSATDYDKLLEAGCDKADSVIALTDSDEVNLVSCGIVSSQWPDVDTIASIRTLSYLSQYDKKILGISHIVNPEQEAATRIAGIIRSRLFSDIIYFTNAHFILFTRIIKQNSKFYGKSLIQMKQELPGQYIIAGIKRNNKVFTPSGNTVLENNDEIVIVADDDKSQDVFSAFDKTQAIRLRRIIVVGGTRIAGYLFRQIPTRTLKNITLIEKDPQICQDFVDEFPQLLVINGTITDEQLWEDEEIGKSDLFISVTENDELNIITSSYAKRVGTKKSMALIKTNMNYINFARHMDIDAPISTTEATVDTLMRHLRGDGIKGLYSVFEGEMEIYEYVLGPSFSHIGKQLKDVQTKGKFVIAGIKRSKDDNFVPDGFYTFTQGDTVLVAATHENYEFVTEFFS